MRETRGHLPRLWSFRFRVRVRVRVRVRRLYSLPPLLLANSKNSSRNYVFLAKRSWFTIMSACQWVIKCVCVCVCVCMYRALARACERERE